MDGVLVIDKPAGLTSHDVVAAARRALRERRVGHTGTLDPMATGVLPLVVGRATRLARFLVSSRKRYDATIVLGIETDTFDAQGTPTGGTGLASSGAPVPSEEDVRAALSAFLGTFPQVPPAYSAKKVGGVAAHRLARRGAPIAPLVPVEVTVHSLSLRQCEQGILRLELEVSAGFYVRALAHDLGRVLECGAHLSALRRTASGEFCAGEAVPLGRLDAGQAVSALIPLDRLLPWAPPVVLTERGSERARHGNSLLAGDVRQDGRASHGGTPGVVRLLAPDGTLLAIAESPPGSPPWPLHPSVVLT
jgi:tRNA pseudouridine55 synthase